MGRSPGGPPDDRSQKLTAGRRPAGRDAIARPDRLRRHARPVSGSKSGDGGNLHAVGAAVGGTGGGDHQQSGLRTNRSAF